MKVTIKSDENCFKFIFAFFNAYKIARQKKEKYYLNKGGGLISH